MANQDDVTGSAGQSPANRPVVTSPSCSSWEFRFSREKVNQAFRKGGMGKDRIPQRRIGQTVSHRELNGRDHFTGGGTQSGKAQDQIAPRVDESLRKALRLACRLTPENGAHGQPKQSICDTLPLRLGLI